MVVDGDEQVFSWPKSRLPAQERQALGIEMHQLSRDTPLVSPGAALSVEQALAGSGFGPLKLPESIQDGAVSVIHRGTVGEDAQAGILDRAVYGLAADFVFTSKPSDRGAKAPAPEDLRTSARQQFGILVHARGALTIKGEHQNRTAPLALSMSIR